MRLVAPGFGADDVFAMSTESGSRTAACQGSSARTSVAVSRAPSSPPVIAATVSVSPPILTACTSPSRNDDARSVHARAAVTV